MWCRDASYALRHGVNTRNHQMLAEVSDGTRQVVLRGIMPRKGLRLLTCQPDRPGNDSNRETRDLRAFQPRPWSNAFQSGGATKPRVLPALNGVKRCHPALGIIDLTTPRSYCASEPRFD